MKDLILIDDLIAQWTSDVDKLEKELNIISENEQYYKSLRVKAQRKLQVLLKHDPRQMRLEIEDEA